jgi:hypothetical protein
MLKKPEVTSPYMPAYAAFTESPSPKRCRDAMDKIRPSPEQYAGCMHQIVRALQMVEFGKRFEAIDPPAAAKKRAFREKAKQLRQAARTLDESLNDSFADSTAAAARAAAFWEHAADVLPVPPNRRLADSKKLAVYMAQHLLKIFGSGNSGTTRNATWHQLAEILYGEAVSFEYLRHQHELNLGPHLFPR